MKAIDINYGSQASIRAKFVLWILEKLAPAHALLNRERVAWNLNSNDFLDYPKGTLGHALGSFYKREKFEPVPKAERHDVFHVLLGYTTDVIDESAMQFFLWGNGKSSVFTIGTCIVSAFLFPTRLSCFINAFRKGKHVKPIRDWNFRWLLNENLEELKTKLFI